MDEATEGKIDEATDARCVHRVPTPNVEARRVQKVRRRVQKDPMSIPHGLARQREGAEQARDD